MIFILYYIKMTNTYAIISEGNFTDRDRETCYIKKFEWKEYLIVIFGNKEELLEVLMEYNTSWKHIWLVEEETKDILSIIHD